MSHYRKLRFACLVVLTAGCGSYEYSLETVKLDPLGSQQAISLLGQSLLRYGQEREPWQETKPGQEIDDALVIIAGVSILARCPGAGESYDLDAPLDQVKDISRGFTALAALAEEVRRDIPREGAESAENTSIKWNSPPGEIDSHASALAEPLWDLGEENGDPLWMLASVQIAVSTPESDLPAPGTTKRDEWATKLESRIELARDLIAVDREDLQQIGDRLEDKLKEVGRDLLSDRPGEDWPGFLGPNRNGVSSEEGIDIQWPLREVWQRDVGQGYAMCSVRGSNLYHFDRVGSRSRLTCLDAVTGFEYWTFEYDTPYADLGGYQDGPRCSPLVDEEFVYLYGAEGMLHCLEAETGACKWKVDTAQQFDVVQNRYGVSASPVIHENLLICVVGGSDPKYRDFSPDRLDLVKGNGTGVVAFDKSAGKVVYECSEYLAGYASPVLADIGETPWCFALMREGLVGFDPHTGTIGLKHPFRSREPSGVTAATPVLTDDGQLLISGAYGLGSELLQMKPYGEPERLWPRDPPTGEHVLECLFSTPVYHEGYFYACHGKNSQDAELRCLGWNSETKALEVKWSEPSLTRVSLLCVEDHLVVLTEYGRLLLVKAIPERFEKVAEMVLREKPAPGVPPEFVTPQKLEYPCWAAPILSHGLLYLLGPGKLVCLELIPDES